MLSPSRGKIKESEELEISGAGGKSFCEEKVFTGAAYKPDAAVERDRQTRAKIIERKDTKVWARALGAAEAGRRLRAFGMITTITALETREVRERVLDDGRELTCARLRGRRESLERKASRRTIRGNVGKRLVKDATRIG